MAGGLNPSCRIRGGGEMADNTSVVAAVARELDQIRERAPEVPGSALAATALTLAAELDNSRNSATSKSMCAKELRETMERLIALAPPKTEDDEIERARKRRAERLAGKSATGATSPS